MATPGEIAKFDKKRVVPFKGATTTTPAQMTPQTTGVGLRPLVRQPAPGPITPVTTVGNTGIQGIAAGDSISPTRFGTGELTEYTGPQSAGDAASVVPNRAKIAEVVQEGPPEQGNMRRDIVEDTAVQTPEDVGAVSARGIGRVFTDAANAGAFTSREGQGPIVVTQDAQGNNIYTQDGRAFNLQEAIMAEGPQPAYRGAGDAFQPFDRRSGLPGYQVSESPVIAGEGANARILEPGFRQVAAGGGQGVAGGGQGVAGGAGYLDQAGVRDLNALNAGLPQVQAAYDAAVASGDQAAIDRARLALVSQKADIERVQMGEGLRRGGYPDQIDVRTEMLKSLPAPDGTAETEIQRRRILSAVAGYDAAAENRAIDAAQAEASMRSAAGGGRDPEARRLDAAKAAMEEYKLKNEQRGINFKSAMDESGNVIPGGLIVWEDQNLAVPADNWATIQALANDGGAFFEDVKAKAPPGTSREDIYDTALRHAMLAYGAKPDK